MQLSADFFQMSGENDDIVDCFNLTSEVFAI